MTINQHEMAKLLGVSTYSVSVALGRKGRISEKTRQRILDGVKQYGYRPNKLAASLRAAKSNTIGVVWDFSGWTGDVMSALELMADLQQLGYTLYQSQSSSDINVVCRNVEEMLARNVDAIIIRAIPDVLRNLQLAKLLETAPITIGICRENIKEFIGDLIIHDRYQVIRDIVAHFAKTGKKRPAISMSMDQESNPPKFEVFKEECIKHGIAHDRMLIDQDYPDRMESIGQRYAKAFNQFFPDQVDVDAIFCPSDIGALFLMKEIKQRNLRIPEDVAIVGFNDIELGRISDPPLATADRKYREISECIKKLLFRRIENPTAPTIQETIHMEFIPKESAG